MTDYVERLGLFGLFKDDTMYVITSQARIQGGGGARGRPPLAIFFKDRFVFNIFIYLFIFAYLIFLISFSAPPPPL